MKVGLSYLAFFLLRISAISWQPDLLVKEITDIYNEMTGETHILGIFNTGDGLQGMNPHL